MKKYKVLLLGLMLSLSLIAQKNQEKVIKRINKLVQKELQKEDIHNVFLSIYSPSKEFDWQTAKGNFKKGGELSTKNPFYTASVGKTFTATAIGLLVDQGKVSFNDPISKYLSADIMKELHSIDGIDYGDSIKISNLLQHTSGLADYFGEPLDGSQSLLELIQTKPNKFWEPEELISFYKAHFEALFVPGTSYYYTDTEYVLLGLIIEKVSGVSFHEFLAENIFIPQALNHTFLNLRSKPIQATPEMAEMYSGELEISTFNSLSVDWAGGAVVSTGADMIKFQQGLREEKLVSTETFKAMQEWTKESKGMYYGYGLRKIAFKELFFTLPSWEAIGHSGLNGTFMYYCPDLDVYIAGSLNQLQASKSSVIFMIKVLMAFNKL